MLHSRAQNLVCAMTLKVLLYDSIGVIAAVMSGCAATTDHIELGYSLQSVGSQVAGASQVHMQVKVEDRRPSQEVGHKINGYGVEMAPIVTDQNIGDLVEQAVEKELRSRGFAVGTPGPTLLLIQLDRFTSSFQMGVFSGSATADVAMDVMIKNVAGKDTFKTWIMAKGENPSLQLATGDNAKVALDQALQNALAKLFGDQKFLDALVASGPAFRAISVDSS